MRFFVASMTGMAGWIGVALSTTLLAGRGVAMPLPFEETRRGDEVRLFNGEDLTGWTWHLESGRPEEVWRVEDQVLICKGNPIGYLRTQTEYESFILKLEWRFNPVTKQAGNSGVLVRMIGEDKVWPRSIEAQLMSENAGDFWNIDEFPMKVDQRRTSGRNTRKLKMAEKPIGEWNEYEIRVCGGDVDLKVNGVLLNQARDALEIPGRICLQSEGAEIHFRNVRLTPLFPGKRPVHELKPTVARVTPKWKSAVVHAGDLVSADVDVSGAKSLWLVAMPTDDGNSCDWSDWVEPRLVTAQGETRLTDLSWSYAMAGWGEARAGKNADGGPLKVGGKEVAYGIGTHAMSAIGYDISGKGFTRFVTKAGIDDSGAAQNPATPSVQFLILVDPPDDAFYAQSPSDLFR